jgi:hypothetical protein
MIIAAWLALKGAVVAVLFYLRRRKLLKAKA